MVQKAKPVSRAYRVLRAARARPRLAFATLIGIMVAALAPLDWPLATRLLTGWDIGVALYLIAAYEIVIRSNTERMRWRAAQEDEGQTAILALTVAAATGTILLSWTFIHTIFALHYAHEYYGERGTKKRGLAFLNENEPDYWDFVYFSFVIGMTSQVSDVTVSSRNIRRTVTAHGVVSFLFNVALVALMVNIAASAI